MQLYQIQWFINDGMTPERDCFLRQAQDRPLRGRFSSVTVPCRNTSHSRNVPIRSQW